MIEKKQQNASFTQIMNEQTELAARTVTLQSILLYILSFLCSISIMCAGFKSFNPFSAGVLENQDMLGG